MSFGIRGLPAAVLLALPLAVLSALVGLSDIPIRVPERYVLGVSGEALTAIFLVAPVTASLAAWEAGRMRRAGWDRWPHARPMMIVALRALVPVLAVAVTALAAAVVVRFAKSDLFAPPDLLLTAKALVIVFAHAVLGFAIGLGVPVAVAVPAVLIADYTWMVIPVSMPPVWLRHLNGTWISCCAVYVEIAPEAWWAAILVAIGIGAAGLLLMNRASTALRLGPALAVLAVAFVMASQLVSELGPDPVRPRSSAELVCSDSNPRVCVWPEHRTHLAQLARLVVAAELAWRDVGFVVPELFTEQRSDAVKGAAVFGFTPQARDADIVAGLANRFIPPGRCDGTAAPLHDPRDYARAWMLRAASIDPRTGGYPADVAGAVEIVQTQPVAAQRQWLDQRMQCQPGVAERR